MLSDNLGFGEIGVYGGGVLRGAPTPRLDRLAAEGMRFTNFNVEVECTPSRSALLTGRMPVRSGTWRAGMPGMPGGLAPWEITLAEMLSEAGYDTAIFGKWHLGDSPGRYPTDQGFDEWWGFPFSTNVASFTKRVGFDPRPPKVPQLLEGSTGRAGSRGRALHARKPPLDRRAHRREVGRLHPRARGRRAALLPVRLVVARPSSLPASPGVRGPLGQRPLSRTSMVEHDHRVGQVLDAIEQAGIADDTLVVYASDNGPDSADYPEVSFAGPFRGYLGSAYEGSIRTPMMLRWPGPGGRGRVSNEIVAIVDFFPTLARIAGAEVPDDRAIDGLDQTDFLLGKSDELRAGGRALLLGAHASRRQVAPLQDLPDGRRPGAAGSLLAAALGPAHLQRGAGPEGGGRHRHGQSLAPRAHDAADLRVPVQRGQGGADPARGRRAGEHGRRDPVRRGRRARAEHVGDQAPDSSRRS